MPLKSCSPVGKLLKSSPARFEGLAGVKDAPGTQTYTVPILSPRWNETKADTIQVTIRYAPSDGYVAYRYFHDPGTKTIHLLATGNGQKIHCHFMVPKNSKPSGVSVDLQPVPLKITQIESSTYADFSIDPGSARSIIVRYE